MGNLLVDLVHDSEMLVPEVDTTDKSGGSGTWRTLTEYTIESRPYTFCTEQV
jgi:hypothetical protein